TATVTAGGGTKAYGTTDPALSATATGFTAADALTVTLSETRAPGEAVGSYVTTATATGAEVSSDSETYVAGRYRNTTAEATGAALSNYSVTYVAGSFSITKAAATVTAGGGTKAYGATDPALSAPTQSGFTAADALTIALSETRAPGEAVGSYVTTATATGAALSNYTVTYVAGTFIITTSQPRPITAVTATADRAAPQPAGTTITLTAGVTGGTAPVEFKWWVYSATGWTVLQEWSAATSATWTPATANPAGVVEVWARSAGALADAPQKFVDLPYAIQAPAHMTVLSVTAGWPAAALVE